MQCRQHVDKKCVSDSPQLMHVKATHSKETSPVPYRRTSDQYNAPLLNTPLSVEIHKIREYVNTLAVSSMHECSIGWSHSKYSTLSTLFTHHMAPQVNTIPSLQGFVQLKQTQTPGGSTYSCSTQPKETE